MRRDTTEFRTPLGSERDGRLEFARGASRVTIQANGGMPDLFRARFEGAVPMMLADDGRVTIEYPRLLPSEWLRPNRRAADVELNPSVPWELVFGGGVSRLRADLRGLALRSLVIMGGASDLDVVLAQPRGVVQLRVDGGAANVALRRPAGVAVDVRIEGGVSKLALDDQRFGALGRETRLASPGAGVAPGRYEIRVGGGATDLAIAESDGREAR